MGLYFEEEQSIFYKQGRSIKTIIETIAAKYVADNPVSPYTFRITPSNGFNQLEDGRFNMDFNTKFPDSQRGDYGYSLGVFYCDEAIENELALSCYSPTKIYLNGELFYKSAMYEEVNVKNQKHLKIKLKKGINEVFIKILKTSSGFGCILGSSNSKWFPLNVYAPFYERSGMGGFIYAYHQAKDCFENSIPRTLSAEKGQSVKWYPEIARNACHLDKIFDDNTQYQSAYGWSSFRTYKEDEYEIRGKLHGEAKIWIDNTLVFSGSGDTSQKLKLSLGYHDLLIKTICNADEWNFEVSIFHKKNQIELEIPQNIKGANKPWIFLGTFDEREQIAGEIKSLYKLFDNHYWCIDKNTYVRPYLENNLYGKWNYPLGVTLYGLLKVGSELNRRDLLDYVTGHITACSTLYEYSLWDKKIYGYPAINHQLVELDMLDDCGSFGSAMLEAYKYRPDDNFKEIARRIADYIINHQERKPDGVFYRKRTGNYMENTLWADDLYMSTPFLIRYYKLTGEAHYIDEVVKQFLLFKKYLWIEEKQVMSHVYDFKYDVATYIPWGRGNGWVIFSLSELLEVLPVEHKRYKEILDFFNLLVEGYYKLQGNNGLWHQVLTDDTSYEETSCSAMFLYAFCRGLRNRWIKAKPDKYIRACNRVVEGIIKHCVDQKGNVYGVCRGSGYSFTPSYYKDELNWILNDTHGIGIVLLAIAEYHKLENIK